ncbi:deoxyribonuclease IV [Sphaerochaeta sp.]|jgi:deoxyribonuclease-4|uniref:deoxyribonuclease IV n=1 Tax=Sphaerochaeta sp. TaxID=1972642 RepID=UPI002FC9D598
MHAIGFHTSIAQGLHLAPARARALGADAMGMFTKNQRQWKTKDLEKDEIARFTSALAGADMEPGHVLVHDSYLINLSHPDATKRRQSIEAFLVEIQRVDALGLHLLNFHPGSHLGLLGEQEALTLVADSLDEALSRSERVTAVIENTAGQGSNLGSSFESLASLYEKIRHKDRIGFCLDTCHCHAAGYDLSSVERFEQVIARFDQLIGLSLLSGMHLNDAKYPMGSRLDRHASLGAGTIGWETFEHICGDERFSGIPLILETPDPTFWKEEINRLRKGGQR